MPLTITNESDERVLLRFNSGSTHHLAPGEVLEEVEHAQVKGNARIHGLAERRLIRLAEAGAAPPEKEGGEDGEAEADGAPDAAAGGDEARAANPRKSSRRAPR